MAQPLGDVNDTKNRSATEMSLRHEMFRKGFSGTYELIFWIVRAYILKRLLHLGQERTVITVRR